MRTALVLALTIGLLAFFLRGVDLAGVWTATRRADGRLLVLAVCITMTTYALRAFRWQYLLAAIGPTHFSTAFRTTVIGFAASFLLPARPGEVLRPFLLARREGLPPTAAFATIILERLLDLVVVLMLFGTFVALVDPASLAGDPAMYARVKAGGLLAAAASVSGLVVFFLLAGHPERLGEWALRIERVLPERLARAVAGLVATFAQGLAVMRQPRRLLVSLILSFPLWLSIAAGIWVTSRAFHMTFGYLGSFLVMTLLVVGVAMPTPGQIGGFHEMYKLAVMTFFGVPESAAVGGAVVLHAVSFLPVTLLGLVFMTREGLTLGRMRQMAAEEKTEDGRRKAEDRTLQEKDAAREGRREPPRSGGPSAQRGGKAKGAPPSGVIK
ncbi:MAG TPA: lysylphosphatidylglycerol synthase transmembrane domain-containing protein [Vicinamibacterales bacterium]|nr:lysylphosphatidylglycerol synthase transmembrane domain-containing protein [Vicinamibacterales bacterium]